MKLAMIAGQGSLPTVLADLAGEPIVVCALTQFPPDTLAVDEPFRLEQLGTLIARLKDRGVTRICLAGAIRRPAIDPTAIDPATMPLIPILQQALAAGDDGALRAVLEIFERAGLTVQAAHDIAPRLLPAPGCRTLARPEAAHTRDATRGAAIVAAMAAVDVGQSCVVRSGQALAIEGLYGTDWMLASLTQRPASAPAGGVLYKAPKPGQDIRVDMPAVGLTTVEGAVAAGLDGIVIAARGVLVLDESAVQAACDAAGLFFWVQEPAD